jgi:hypothetical protein
MSSGQSKHCEAYSQLQHQKPFQRLPASMELAMISLHHRLESLGWRVIETGWCDARYRVVAKSCGHRIIGIANTASEAYVATCRMAMKLTRNGLHLPRF